MNSILNKIIQLRNGTPLTIDHQNSNRYRIVSVESNGSKTAYYFTAPIYNKQTRKLLDMNFFTHDGTVQSYGSNTTITVSNYIRIEDTEGSCIVSLSGQPKLLSDREVLCDYNRIFPTTNGVAIKSMYSEGKSCTFTVEVNKPFLGIRANDKYFALMNEQFRPFVVISCLGVSDVNGKIFSPAKITYQKITDRKFTITLSPCSILGGSIIFEVNLYESKLFYDATVESKNPKLNNVFGCVGFIGTSNEYGEQWLYARPDFSKMSELNDRKILGASLHLPKLNQSLVDLSVSKVSGHFCSFGSTWENKVAEAEVVADSQITDTYINLDMTMILVDEYSRLVHGEGFILKAKNINTGFSVIATGDSYLYPQILEINYR